MTLPDHRTGKVSSGGVGIFYRAFGERGAEPILIVHGLSFFSYDWIGVADALARDRAVVAIDMPGFGDSDWAPDGDYSVPAVAGHLRTLLDAFGWPRAILMGHSMGGRHCTWCAAENPDRVARLVLVDYSPQNAPAGSKRVTETVAGVPDRFESLDAAMDYFHADKVDPVMRARYEAYTRPVEGGIAIKRDTRFRDNMRRALEGKAPPLGVDMWDALARVRCPILVVRGARSDMFAAETAARVRETNPGLTLVEVDAGHNVAGDNPDALIAEVRKVL